MRSARRGGGALAGARAASVAAQAKVNLYLRVLAREASGYHQLETLFARLDLADRVVVRVRDDGHRALDCVGPAMPPAGLGAVESNLAYRAALAYADAAGWPSGFEIAVEKHIPTGGGLGGGSADAGAVLRVLNALNPEPLPQQRLFALASALGADVPFMTAEAPLALAWGRGERMMAFPALPARDVALLVPDFGVSTADAYGWLAERRAAEQEGSGARGPAPRMLFPHQFVAWEPVYRLAANDFEPVVLARHPALAAARDALAAAGARIALMSGSGSTLFGVFDRPPDAATLERAAGCAIRLTRTAERVVSVEPAD
ncbi:MAG TPA: 4-(cytidine 5'-diphospho)-2-C-methyl-D-erythritol kinase [Gemmatimonadaceae bacterium]|nr:4-(cytidine 5'-diphospho)-2-C-methyl-D-erythritol kinase [Gemmatimonadaceae bacterium]